MPDTFIQFLILKWPLLLIKLWEQFYLVSIAAILATLIGLPLGMFIRYLDKTKILVLGLVSALWTVPSLALLALFIPLLGIGFKPAILALTIYAILPVLRNTVTGLENVSPASIEAARGLGFTQLQRLQMVELPLALPVIVAGIRTSVSISIGVATLASFVGAGGLGDFINQGLALNNANLILLGAIPAAMMALVFDYGIAIIESRLAMNHASQKTLRQRIRFWLGVGIIFLITGSIFIINYYFNEKKQIIKIASKNFTEQIILGEMMSQLIEAKTHLHVVKMLNLGSTAICQAAITQGDIDIYPEYTGTAYLTVLKLKTITDADTLFDIVQHEYRKKFDLVWLQPFRFNNSQALAVRKAFARQHDLHQISNLKRIEKQIIIGAPPEFIQREDGLTGLKRVYHLNIGQIRQMDPNLLYNAVRSGNVNVINAFSTDSRILAYQLTVLKDDKHFYPAYYAAPVIRADTLKKHPQLRQVLQMLADQINDKTMQQLNYQVDIQHKPPSQVAKNFLRSRKLLS